jgi:hypothetical protein
MGATSAVVRFALGSANTSSGSFFIESRRRGIFCSSPCAAGTRLGGRWTLCPRTASGLDALPVALIRFDLGVPYSLFLLAWQLINYWDDLPFELIPPSNKNNTPEQLCNRYCSNKHTRVMGRLVHTGLGSLSLVVCPFVC